MLQSDQTFPWKVENYKIYTRNVIDDTVQRLFFLKKSVSRFPLHYLGNCSNSRRRRPAASPDEASPGLLPSLCKRVEAHVAEALRWLSSVKQHRTSESSVGGAYSFSCPKEEHNVMMPTHQPRLRPPVPHLTAVWVNGDCLLCLL